MSDHSTGAYKELWGGVGVTFEAVQAEVATAKSVNMQDTLISLNVPRAILQNQILLTFAG